MAGTPMPTPRQQFFDGNGDPLANGTLRAYQAGTTSPVPLYQDVDLTTPHTWPAGLDGSGMITVFLDAISYKFEVRDSLGNTIYSQDNVSGVPSFASANDVTGIAGENLTIREVVALSDGSVAMGGAGTAGRWVRASSVSRELSVYPPVLGIAMATIASGAAGAIRLSGLVPSYSGLSANTYYVGATGAITSSRPQNGRIIGRAVSTTVLLLMPESRSVLLDCIETPIFLGGSANIGRTDTSFPAGTTSDKLVPGGVMQNFAQSRLPPGVYKLRGILAIDNAAGTVTADLYNLDDNTSMASITSISTTGERVVSSAITINAADTTEKSYGVKIKTSNATYAAYGWGFELFRETF